MFKNFSKKGSCFLSFPFLVVALLHLNQIQQVSYAFPSDEKLEIYKSLDDGNETDSSLPSTPMELMNLLQRSSAMNDATPPSDAIDQALQLFDEQFDEDSSIKK